MQDAKPSKQSSAAGSTNAPFETPSRKDINFFKEWVTAAFEKRLDDMKKMWGRFHSEDHPYFLFSYEYRCTRWTCEEEVGTEVWKFINNLEGVNYRCDGDCPFCWPDSDEYDFIPAVRERRIDLEMR